MGGAMLRGWLSKNSSKNDVIVVDPQIDSYRRFKDLETVTFKTDVAQIDLKVKPSAIVLAIKPQVIDMVIEDARQFVNSNCLFLSIVAGKTIGYLEKHLGQEAIIRTMPNTPAAIGRGITVAYANKYTNIDQINLCTNLLNPLGKITWANDEAVLDPATALSGGGPAYVFLLAECLEKAGIAAGLPKDLAAELAIETVSGAGELLNQTQDSPLQLRLNVTSPGGTTAEAIKVLTKDNALERLLTKAISAATQRSRELAN